MLFFPFLQNIKSIYRNTDLALKCSKPNSQTKPKNIYPFALAS